MTNGVDSTVLGRARRGDPRAFEAIVREFDPGLRAFAHRLLGASWNEDVLQEAYVRAYRGLSKFRGSSDSIGGWLYRIVYGACIDTFREARRQPRIDTETSDEDLAASPGPGVDEAVIQRTEIAAALAELPPEERASVVLVDGLGFDYATAARILGIPRGTVASRLNRARPRIRQAIREETSVQ